MNKNTQKRINKIYKKITYTQTRTLTHTIERNYLR